MNCKEKVEEFELYYVLSCGCLFHLNELYEFVRDKSNGEFQMRDNIKYQAIEYSHGEVCQQILILRSEIHEIYKEFKGEEEFIIMKNEVIK